METEPVKAYAEPYVHEGDTFGPPPPGESESEA